MSASKSKGIPLAELLKPSPANNRNLEILLGNDSTNQPGEKNADAKLMQAMARELRSSRDTERNRAAPFRKGRSSGEDRDEESKRRAAIRALAMKYPNLSNRELYQHPEARSIREHIKEGRFGTIRSEEVPRRKRPT